MATLLLATIPANAFWSAALTMLGGYIDSKLFGPHVTQEVGKMSDLQMQTASYGAPIPLILGTCRSTGNVIWSTKFVEHTKTETQGGKGGGGGVTTTTYSYTVSFAVGICQGPITAIGRVWADGKLVDLAKYQHTVYLGGDTQTPDSWMEAVEGAGNVPAFRGLAYIVFKDLAIGDFGNRIPSFSFEVTRQIDNVKALVETVSLSAGLQYTDVDASDLEGLAITGISSAGDQTRRSIIEQLQAVFLFDAIERSGKIVFKRRNANTAYEIPDEYLGAYETSPPNEPYTLQYKDERELPRRLTINYLSKDKDYQQGTMSAYRQITQSKNEQTVSVQMVLADTDAKELAEVRLFEEWQNRKTLSLTLSNQFGWLLPGDILKVPIQDQKQNFMITKTTYGKPGLIKIEAVATTQQVYTFAQRVVDSETNPVIPASPGNVSMSLIDLPLLPGESSAERVFAACTSDGAFYGANLFRSNDGGGTWSYVGQVTQNAVVGTTITVLPPGNTVTWDEASTVDITLSHGTLESRPAEDVLNHFNAALIGAEIVQFKQAALIAANTYRLSGLLRGRLGTEHEVGCHIANEPFLMLNSLQSISFPASEWHMDKLYRIGPSTLPVTNDKFRNYTVNLDGIGARPYSVCHVSGFRDGTGSLTVSWVRRARMNGDWKPYTDVPVGENSETYQVDVVSADGNIKRTITVNEPKAVYSANEQIADFGSLQAVVRVRIYQMSEVYGRGAVKEEVL